MTLSTAITSRARYLAIAAALLCVSSTARSQDSTAAPMPSRAPDTVRVWVPSLNLHGTQGVVRRQTPDTVYFILYYPTRERWLDTRVPGDKIERIMARDGVYRSRSRALKGAAWGAVTGAVVGGVIGVFTFQGCVGGYTCNHGLDKTSGRSAIKGATMGGLGGAILCGLIGYGKTTKWRQIYP